MQLYDCTVRLSGGMHNEVRKTGVTAAEIAVLKALHQNSGVESVHSVSATTQIKRDDMEERARLQSEYGPALAKRDDIRTLSQLLGHETAPLPKTIPGVNSAPAPKSGKRAKVEPRVPDVEVEGDQSETSEDVEKIGDNEFA